MGVICPSCERRGGVKDKDGNFIAKCSLCNGKGSIYVDDK